MGKHSKLSVFLLTIFSLTLSGCDFAIGGSTGSDSIDTNTSDSVLGGSDSTVEHNYSINIAPSTTTLNVGDIVQLRATLVNDDTNEELNFTLNWYSENRNVVTVSNDGLVTAVGEGSARVGVSYEWGSKPDEAINALISFTVNRPEIQITSSTLPVIAIGETHQIEATLTNYTANTVTFEYESEDDTIATVSETGLVTGVAEGETTIEVTTTIDNTLYTNSVTVEVYDSKAYTEGLEFTLSSNQSYYSVTGYNGTEGDVYIPAYYNGLPVEVIGGNAFYGSTSLTSIYISKNVTSIGYQAFHSCSSLSTVTVSENSQLQTIGNYAFNFCRKLTSIYIPDSVTTIGSYSFAVCTSLTSIYISDNVTSIDIFTFDGCTSLTTVTFSENSKLKTISSNAFSNCSSLTSFYIPISVTYISDKVFFRCSSLTSIYIPDSVYYIGFGAFEDCTSLSTVNISENSQLQTIGDFAFSGCSKLTSIYIPDSVTTIDRYAFYNCQKLTSIYIPISVTSIGESAFRYCYALTIYCEVTSKPSGWDSSWNQSDHLDNYCPVKWGYTYEAYLAAISN